MKRRNYIKTVGASFGTTVIPTVSAQQDQEEDESEFSEQTIYAHFVFPKLSTQVLHIDIEEELIESANYIHIVQEDGMAAFNIADEESGEATWRSLNVAVGMGDIKQVYVGGEPAEEWDVIHKKKGGILTKGDADHGLLEIASTGTPIHIDGANKFWNLEDVEYERLRVPVDELRFSSTKAINEEGETEYLPVFSVRPKYNKA